MIVTSAQQVDFEMLKTSRFDLVLCSSGFEHRASNVTKKLALESARKIVIPFADRKVLSRAENDEFFRSEEFEFLDEVDGSDFAAVYEIFLRTVGNQHTVNVLVDYSCMTRAWYGAIVRALFDIQSLAGCLEVTFAYSPATYCAPSPSHVNTMAGPLMGFVSLQALDRPAALVIGLGYEKVKAAGLREYIDPARTVAFYTDPTYDSRFVDRVLENNSELIASLNEYSIVAHPMADMDTTSALLHDAISALSRRYRVIVAPLGVKPFSLLTMLLCARYGSFDVWRVSGGAHSKPTQRFALGPILAYRVRFNSGNTEFQHQ